MKRQVSVSGGKSSAYVAANYPSDYLVFALVTSNDPLVKYPDEGLRKAVSDRIGREFIGTLEDDVIIHTMFDLEQYLGREINWVVGDPFEDVIKYKGGWLPSMLRRFCTTHLKIDPLYEWWRENVNEPMEVAIGYRLGEEKRAARMMAQTNEDGLIVRKSIVGRTKTGNQNTWGMVAWQKPIFPMIDDGIRRDDVYEFWKNKPVRFAERNNCVGCFHRNPMLLRLMWDKHPNKMAWFEKMEQQKNQRWRTEVSYSDIKKHKTQLTLMDLEEFTECDSGHCGL